MGTRARQSAAVRLAFAAACALVIGGAWITWRLVAPPAAWTASERDRLESLWIGNLGAPPPDPTNAVADDPRAAEFGHRLFFDTRLSRTGTISCATCHAPERHFSDGLPKAVALGTTERNTPSIVGTAWSPWLYWDGRRDSQWAQALVPLEHPAEHGATREAVVDVIASDPDYRQRYRTLFGALPPAGDGVSVDRAFANVGKAIAAYERRLMPGRSRFDGYVEHLLDGGDPIEQPILTKAEIRGLRLFLGKARCIECHNGPLFTNNEFHNTGLLSAPGDLPDRGRADGVREVLEDPFNCVGEFSDDPERRCPELEFVRRGPELLGATRTPSLRNVAITAPFQSKGQFESIAAVIAHYDEAPLAMIGHNETKALGLSRRQRADLEAFIATLAAPVDAAPKWLEPPPDDR